MIQVIHLIIQWYRGKKQINQTKPKLNCNLVLGTFYFKLLKEWVRKRDLGEGKPILKTELGLKLRQLCSSSFRLGKIFGCFVLYFFFLFICKVGIWDRKVFGRSGFFLLDLKDWLIGMLLGAVLHNWNFQNQGCLLSLTKNILHTCHFPFTHSAL